MMLCSHIIAFQPIEIGPEPVIKRIPAGHAELLFPSLGYFAVLIDELDFSVSLNRVRLGREAIVLVEKVLDFFPCRDACTLLAKIIRAGTLQDTDIVAQILEYDTLKEACKRPADLLTGNQGREMQEGVRSLL